MAPSKQDARGAAELSPCDIACVAALVLEAAAAVPQYAELSSDDKLRVLKSAADVQNNVVWHAVQLQMYRQMFERLRT